MRFLPLWLLAPVLCSAAILPDTVGPWRRAAAPSAVNLSDRALWDELGLKESETASYENGTSRFQASVYRLQDSTSCLAAFDWQRPPQAKPSTAAKLAAETDDILVAVHGNYLFTFSGYKPIPAELSALFDSLRNVDTTALPTLPNYMPSQELVPNSERYVIGPKGLEMFAPSIPPSVAGFRQGGEAILAVFHSPKGNFTTGLFSYPTHQIAMQRAPEFEKLPGAAVKRTGPIVAVVLSSPDPDLSERLLAGIRYQAEVTRDEYVPTRRDNPGELLYNAFLLIGILLALAIVSGLMFGGLRAARRRGRKGEEPEPMISLHLEQ